MKYWCQVNIISQTSSTTLHFGFFEPCAFLMQNRHSGPVRSPERPASNASWAAAGKLPTPSRRGSAIALQGPETPPSSCTTSTGKCEALPCIVNPDLDLLWCYEMKSNCTIDGWQENPQPTHLKICKRAGEGPRIGRELVPWKHLPYWNLEPELGFFPSSVQNI